MAMHLIILLHSANWNYLGYSTFLCMLNILWMDTLPLHHIRIITISHKYHILVEIKLTASNWHPSKMKSSVVSFILLSSCSCVAIAKGTKSTVGWSLRRSNLVTAQDLPVTLHESSKPRRKVGPFHFTELLRKKHSVVPKVPYALHKNNAVLAGVVTFALLKCCKQISLGYACVHFMTSMT